MKVVCKFKNPDWQIAQPGASCREAIDQARNLCHLQNRPQPSDKTSPYGQARGQLPLERLEDIHQAVVTEAEAGLATRDLGCGLRVFALDGTTLTAPDTPDKRPTGGNLVFLDGHADWRPYKRMTLRTTMGSDFWY